MEKTNAMRILDRAKIEYKVHDYTQSGVVSGMDVATALGINPSRVYKTLVLEGKSGTHYVFMMPVDKELDLKKAAEAASEKSVEMLKSKDLLPLTGYVHGGCSPVGMKKPFKTFIDKSAESFETICFSGGKIGIQLEMPLSSLKKAVNVLFF